ncbi:MAG: GGDEF domain-containing protein [Desulfobulbus propionicus]|nr:MAG: GGDEF domain-containing protein [Desulfobulbus propionicus]
MTISRDAVLKKILHSNELPTLPVVASTLLTITAKEETTLSDIAQLISRDVALSSKVLRVSNSSFYSFPQQISTINQAVSILGTNAIRSLVLSFSFLSIRSKNSSPRFNFKQFWEQSLVCATAAKLILDQVDGANTEEIFISGLLHNIGQLIFATTLPTPFDQVLEKLESDPDASVSEIEQEILHISHSEAGYAVAQQWGFPETLLLPIQYGDNPGAYTGKNKDIALNIKATYLAQLLSKIYYSEKPEQYHRQFRTQAKKLLPLKGTAINTILHQINHEIDKVAEYFNIKIDHVKSVAEILQEANLRLSLLNLSYEEMNRELIKTKMELEKLTEELVKKNLLLENLANLDGLTGIHNHRYFHSFLDNEINRAIRNQGAIALLLADIDHFKKFNDTYGHQVGDFVLKEFCRVAQENIREYDLIARYGGEEFVFVLPDTNMEEAQTAAEKIRTLTNDYTFDDGQRTYHVTISIGIAVAHPESREFNKDDFIGSADSALYAAKKAGRNRVAVFSPKKKWFPL